MEVERVREWFKQAPTVANVAYVVLRLVANPSDINPTFRLRDLTGLPGFKLVMAKVRSDPDSASIIRDRFLAEAPHDIEALAKLPEGTLGHSHAKFIKHFGIPVVFYPGELLKQWRSGAVSDETYLRMRARETHDIWHTVLGIPPDGYGEMEISTVYLRQMNLPLSGILLAVGFPFMTLQLPHGYQDLMESVVKGWTVGGRSKPLIGARWEEMWSLPISEVRRRLGVEVTKEAWDQVGMAELERRAVERFRACASNTAVPPYLEDARERFLSTALLD